MPSQRESIIFCETFGIKQWFASIFGCQINFYCKQSFVFLQLSKIFGLKPIRARTLSDGDLKSSPGIRKAAYWLALSSSEKILQDLFCISKMHLLGIDFELILRKLLVEFLFKKYHFYGLASQYALEHPNFSGILYSDMPFQHEEMPLIPGVQVVTRERSYLFSYIASLIAMSIYPFLFYWKNRKENQNIFDSIICQIDGKKSYDMYKNLFGHRSNLFFLIERHNLMNRGDHEYFGADEADQLGFFLNGLSPKRFKKLRILTTHFIVLAFKNFYQLLGYRSLFFNLYIEIARGLLKSLDAQRSAYVTYEHLFLPNAVRNELLRADGNITISIPIGAQIESHFFSSGYLYNYDILCSTGKLQESVYAIQQATTKIILPTGAYEIHKNLEKDENYLLRLNQLREFKGDNISITIVSSGVQSETYSGEIQLMHLARKLAAQEGVKVFIRPKPILPPLEYRNSIKEECGMSESIMITGSEYQLTDFLEVTDLFITFASHAGADICGMGGEIFFINFMNDDAFALWQNAVKGVYLQPESAFDQIMSWVRDFPIGQRKIHNQRMKVLSDLIAYKFDTFESYKLNINKQLSYFLP